MTATTQLVRVTLLRVFTEFTEDDEVKGIFWLKHADSRILPYYLRFPQTDLPDPVGWQALQNLVQVDTATVTAGWDLYGHNDVAEQLCNWLHTQYAGYDFLALIHPNAGPAVELIPLAMPLAAAAPAQHEVVPETSYAYVSSLELSLDATGQTQARLLFVSGTALIGALLIPDVAFEAEPPDWFFVESLVPWPASHISTGWVRTDGPPVNPRVQRMVADLKQIVERAPAPIVDGRIDFNLFRRHLVGARCQTSVPTERKQPFLFSDQPLEVTCARAWELLKDTTGPFLFRSQGLPGQSTGAPALIRTIDNMQKLEPLSEREQLRGVLARGLRYVRLGRTLQYVPIPNVIPDQMMTFVDQGLLPINALVRTPTMRKDGTVNTTPGYDAASRLWYAPDAVYPDVPLYPTRADVRAAIGVIGTPFSQFPFVEQAGAWPATLACLLDQLVRPMVTGPRPLFVFDAPALRGAGTGKCSSEGTLVLSSKGLCAIEDLAPPTARHAIEDTTHAYGAEGPQVLTAENRLQPASHFYVGGARPVRHLWTQRNYEFCGTYTHPIRVATPQGPVWRSMADIKVGDYVAVHIDKCSGATEDLIDEPNAWLLGTLLAQKEVMLEDCLIYDRAPVSSLEAFEKLKAGRTRDLRKAVIPTEVLRSSAKIWIAFLRGLIHTDANFTAECSLDLIVQSEELGKQVQIVLAALGICCLRVSSPTLRTPQWLISITDGDMLLYARRLGLPTRVAGLHPERIINRFYKLGRLIPCMSDLAAHLYEGLSDAQRRTLVVQPDTWRSGFVWQEEARQLVETCAPSATRDVLEAMMAPHIRWERVAHIENDIARTYDLCVSGDKSYVGNAFHAHNTLLASAIGAIITGRETAITPWPEDAKELSHIITSKLLGGSQYVVFDNLEGIVKHKDLAALSTTTMWSARLLHTNDSPTFAQTATWVLTLNGATFSPDIARRTATIKLDAKIPDPHRRQSFRYPELIQTLLEQRVAIIHACLTLARYWVVVGCPQDKTVRSGSFESWLRVVGGILHSADIHGLDRALEESRSRDVDSMEHEQFVAAWAETCPEQAVTPIQLAMLAESRQLYGEILEKANPTWRGRRMATIAQKLVGHVFPQGWHVFKHPHRVGGQVHFVLSQTPPALVN